MKKPTTTALIILLTLAALHLWLPHHAAGKLRDAINTHNAPQVAAMTDFAAVKSSIRHQMFDSVAKEKPTAGPANVFARFAIDRALDEIVNEAGISKILLLGKAVNGTTERTVQSVSWRGIGRVDVELSGEQSVIEMSLTGGGWKITGIRLHDRARIRALLPF